MAWNDNLAEGSPAHTLASTDANVVRAVAGPGSGKSFAIKRRIARLLEEGIAPNEILAITFTRTSAQDLKREISSIGIQGADEVNSSTLHSLALKILMQARVLEYTGRTPRMVLDHETAPAFRDINNEAFGGIPAKKELLKSYIGGWARLQTDEPGFVQNETQEQFEREIVAWLTAHKGILVGEVIPLAIQYLRNNPASPEVGRYRTILVDEYQDLNRSEQEFIRLIRGDASIVVVGDDDQSIYGFKFAHPEGIREIDRLYGEFQDIPFDECRRCPTRVTNMASQLISRNPNRTLGALVPHKDNAEGIIDIIQWKNYSDEMTGLTSLIVAELKKGIIAPEDVLILTQRRQIGYKLRDLLLAADQPVKSYFRETAISSDKVKRAYSLLSHLANPDDLVSQRYLLGVGSQDFRANQYSILRDTAREKGVSVIDVIKQILRGEIVVRRTATIVGEYRRIVTDLATLKAAILHDAQNAIEECFITTDQDAEDFYEFNMAFQQAVSAAGLEALHGEENFDAWFKEVFDSLQESMAFPDSPEKISHIRIMSLHASKGLSAKFVILCSMVDPVMPFIKDREQKTEEEIRRATEEQRRLFYVALTRCKASQDYDGKLIVSSFIFMPSRLSLQLSIPGTLVNNNIVRVSATRFLEDFRAVAPAPVKGEDLMK